MIDKNQKQNNKATNISPEEVIAHGIMQLDGTYKYKGMIFDENGNPLEVKGEKENEILEKINKENSIKLDKTGENKKINQTKAQIKKEETKEETKEIPIKPKIKKQIIKDANLPIKEKGQPSSNNNDVFQEYPREKIRSLFQQLPQEVKDVLNSDKEVKDVEDICERYKITDKFLEIQKMILYVALGLKNMDEFKGYIKEKIAQRQEDVDKIYREIFRFVFFPIKDLIGVTYKTAQEEKEIEGKINNTFTKTKTTEPQTNNTEKKPIVKDKYREPIE